MKQQKQQPPPRKAKAAKTPKRKAIIEALAEKHRESAKREEPKEKGPGHSRTYSQKMGDEICERLADGESLRSIAKTEGFPHATTIYRWSLDT